MNEVTTASALSHDELVERIARQAINSNLFYIYTNTKRIQMRPVKGQYPHIVGVGKTSKRVELVGMVETAESLHNVDAAARRWRTLALLQAAIYLYIPRGYGPDARALCLRQAIRISDFRHYWFDDDNLHIKKYFA